MKTALVIGHDIDNQGAYGNAGVGEWKFWDELISELSLKGMLPKDTYVLYRNADINGYTAQMLDIHKRIDKIGCKVSIECHFNSFPREDVNGNEVLYCSQGGKKIADIFDEEFDSLPNRDRGVKKVSLNPYPIADDRGAGFCCRGISYAIIIEPFFGSHQRDYIYGGVNRDVLLQAMSRALERI